METANEKRSEKMNSGGTTGKCRTDHERTTKKPIEHRTNKEGNRQTVT